MKLRKKIWVMGKDGKIILGTMAKTKRVAEILGEELEGYKAIHMLAVVDGLALKITPIK